MLPFFTEDTEDHPRHAFNTHTPRSRRRRGDACSVMSDSFLASWAATHQVPLSMELSRLEYWSGLPFPSPGDLPDPGMEPTTPVSRSLAGEFFTTASHWKPLMHTPERSPNYRRWVVVNFSFFESSLCFSGPRKLDPQEL